MLPARSWKRCTTRPGVSLPAITPSFSLVKTVTMRPLAPSAGLPAHQAGFAEDVDNLEVVNPDRVSYISPARLSVDDCERVIQALKRRFPEHPRPSQVRYLLCDHQPPGGGEPFVPARGHCVGSGRPQKRQFQPPRGDLPHQRQAGLFNQFRGDD